MARKPSDIVQPNLRIREELRRRLEQAAKRNRVSLNAEMTARLKESFDRETSRSHEMIVEDMENNWARYGQALHELNKQGDLMRAAEVLIKQIEQSSAKNGEAIRKAVENVKQVLTLIEMEAAKLPRRMHTTGRDQ